MIKHQLNNGIINLIVKYVLYNFNQMIVMNFWRVKIGPCFQKFSWNEFFFCFSNILYPMGFNYGLYEFSFKIFKVISLYLLNINIINMGFDLDLKGSIRD
jgi:hypothetical protein